MEGVQVDVFKGQLQLNTEEKCEQNYVAEFVEKDDRDSSIFLCRKRYK